MPKKVKRNIASLPTSQFKALLIKDILGVVQGQSFVYGIRVLLPSVLVLVLYVMMNLPQKPDSGVIPPVGLGDLKLPRCYELAGRDSSKGVGAKSSVEDCRLLAYFPRGAVTQELMSGLAESIGLNQSDVIGYETEEAFQADKRLRLFAVEFQLADAANWSEALQKMSILIRYNQSYLDMPSFYNMYGDERVATQMKFNYVIDMAAWSSFPLAIQAHLSAVIAHKSGVKYSPLFTPTPKSAREITSLPNPMATLLIYAVGFIFQFIFVCLHIQQEKHGTLDALRLAGVSDIVYWGEFLLFQYSIYLLGIAGQLFVMFCLPGGCGMFIAIQPAQILIISIVFGLYSTAFGVFLNMVLNLKTTGIVIVTGLYVILLVLHCMFGPNFVFDPTIIGPFLMNILRLLYPYAYCVSAVSSVILRTSLTVLKDEDTLLEYIGVDDQITWKDFGSQTENRGFVNISVDYIASAPAEALAYATIQAIVFFLCGWLFGEWLPRNASACRAPWAVVKSWFTDPSSVGYTSGQIMQANKKRFKSHVENRLRRALTEEEANRCLQEIVQNCDDVAKKNTLDILMRKTTGREVLVAHHLHKSFTRPMSHKQQLLLGKEHDAVQSVSLAITEGQIYGLCGYSGAGKTTVQAMLTGSIAMDKPGYKFFENTKESRRLINNAWVGNQFSIRDDIVSVRRVLSYCPQFNTCVYKNLTVEQNLRFMCRIRNIPDYDHDRIIQSLLQRLNIAEQQDKLISSMSGGQQRRVVIAMTLINPKSVISLFDEPTSGSDPHTKRVIWANLKTTARRAYKSPVIVGSSIETARVHRVKERKPGVILTSHDLAEMECLCDEIAIMNAGQISAIGTPLDLKRRFGSGFTLTLILKNAQDSQPFQELFQNHLASINAEAVLIDSAGASLIYSLSHDDRMLAQIVYFIEEQTREGQLVEDFCLERTSLDEVFVKVGKMFKQTTESATVQQELELGDETSQSYSKIKDIEYGSDESLDDYINGQQVDISKMSKQDIQKIMSPPKAEPSTFHTMLYKLVHSDQMHRWGWLGVVLTPILILLFNFIITNVVMESIQATAYENFGQQTKALDPICQNCQFAEALGVPIHKCEGFDSWGLQSICSSIHAAQGKSYLPNATWYGGSSGVWPSQQNLYHTQQYPGQLYFFDKENKLLGKPIDPVLRQKVPGVKKTQRLSVEINGIKQQLAVDSYIYTTTNGIPATKQISNEFKALGSISSLDAAQSWDVRPIAVQHITQANEKLNLFDIYRDQVLHNGYDLYDNSHDLQDSLQLILSREGLVAPKLLDRGLDCPQNRICIKSDDHYLIQKYQQYVAESLPLGFIDLDWAATADGYQPLISSFAPARTLLAPYEDYGLGITVKKSSQLKQILKQFPEMDRMLGSSATIRLAPCAEFSLAKRIDFDEVFISPQTALMDLNTRLMNVVLRKELATPNVNVRFGVQMFEHTMLDVIDLTMMQLSLIVSVILMVICTYWVLPRYGQHIVQDRERQLRLQFFLTGMSQKTYWATNIFYCLMQSFGTHIIIGIVGRFVFQIQAICRFDPGAYIVLALVNSLSQVGISMFLASVSRRLATYNVLAIIVLLVSIIIVFFQITSFQLNAPWYGFIFPSLGYSLLFIACSFFGLSLKDLTTSSFGALLLWSAVYSVVLLVAAVLLDQHLSLNGHAPNVRRTGSHQEEQEERASQNAARASKGAALLKQLAEAAHESPCLGASLEAVALNAIPETVDIRSSRDKSCALEEDRMDVDVFRERMLVHQNPCLKDAAPLVIKNLQKQFGSFLAIRDVTLHVPHEKQGTVFALLGANGAAKTTLFNCVMGLLRPTYGTIHLNGYDMTDPDQAQEAYKMLGVCPQLDAYNPTLSIRDHLRIFAALHGVQWALLDDIVEKLAAFVQLDDVLDKPASQVSGGQRRRMSLVLALVG